MIKRAKGGESKLPRYPWDDWFRRRSVILRRGRDFECMSHSMSIQVRNAAKLRGLRVSVNVTENGSLVVQVKREVKKKQKRRS